MAAEEILKLLDSYWFEREIFSGKPSVISSSSPESTQQHQENPKPENPKIPEISILQVRSLSDRCLRCHSGFSPDTAGSPHSVISTPGPEKIVLFGKEIIIDFSESVEDYQGVATETTYNTKKNVGDKSKRKRSRRRRERISRSLSELEYEELKGFMDLGFVFTEEDKTSSLVSILPGLQRWGKKSGGDDQDPINVDQYRVSRPYLSEAWDALRRRKSNKPPVNWRFPVTCNENSMKLHLKAWAQNVASSVR